MFLWLQTTSFLWQPTADLAVNTFSGCLTTSAFPSLNSQVAMALPFERMRRNACVAVAMRVGGITRVSRAIVVAVDFYRFLPISTLRETMKKYTA